MLSSSKYGDVPPPTEVTLALTSACNLRCRMCGQRGDAAVRPPRPAQLGIDTVKRVIDQAIDAAPRVGFYFWGGEPLLHPGLGEACIYAKDRGAYVDVNTNGVFLSKHALGLVQSGLDALYVSLDGPSASSCDAIRGLGTFDAALRGVHEVLECRNRLGLRHPEIYYVCTVLGANYLELPGFALLCRSSGVDGLCVQLPVYVTPEWGRATGAQWRSAYGIDLVSWRAFDHPHLRNGILSTQLASSLSALKADSRGFKLLITPYGYSCAQLSEYFDDVKWRMHSRHARCEKVYFRTNIQPDGSVTPCGDFPEYVCGNVLHEALTAIWNGEKYRRFREALAHALFPVCYRCCELFDGRERVDSEDATRAYWRAR